MANKKPAAGKARSTGLERIKIAVPEPTAA